MKIKKENIKLSIRKKRKQRVQKQNHVLNFLRLAYYLNPEKLKVEGIKVKNINYPYIEKLLKNIGVPNNIWDDIIKKIKNYVVFQALLFGIVSFASEKGKIQANKKDGALEIIKEDLSFPLWHQMLMPLVLKGKNPKAVNLEKFTNKIITYQNFELRKFIKNSKKEKPPVSYLDYLQDSTKRSSFGRHEKKYIELNINKAKARERIIQKDIEYSDNRITDKDIALALYGSTNSTVLQRVRQDHKRLRKYCFI